MPCCNSECARGYMENMYQNMLVTEDKIHTIKRVTTKGFFPMMFGKKNSMAWNIEIGLEKNYANQVEAGIRCADHTERNRTRG